MKKIFKSLFLMAAASATIIACNKEVATPSGEELVKVTIIAGNPATETATKTEIDGLTPYWSVGDVIGVSNGTSTNYPFTTGITSRSATASFTGETEVSSTLYAYYPFQSNGIDVEKGAKVDVPSTQRPTATSFDGAADIMVAKAFTVDPASATVENLQFKRLGAIVKVVLKDKESTMTSTQHPSVVSLTAETNLVGRLNIDMVNQELGALYYNPSKTVSAAYTSTTQYELNGTNATYFIVYPQILEEGTTLTVTAETEGYSISKDITVPAGGIELAAGKITTLNINLLASHITVSSSGDALPFNDDMAWANNGSSDATADISSQISSAANSNGLYVSASKAYKGKGGLKLGSGSASGYVTTKDLNLSGAFNIAVSAGKYSSDTGSIIISVDDVEVERFDDFSDVLYVNIPAGTYTKKSKVTIGTSSKRAYLYSVNITEGEYVIPSVINVTSDNPMAVANTADIYAIEYTITNPKDGASITASANVSWIHDFDYSDGEVDFEVDAQVAEAIARTGVITLSYPDAADVTVTVNQAKGATEDPTTTVEMNSFTDLSGYVGGDSNVSYVASKGAAATAPAVNGNEIRIYQNGGLLTITANNGKKITEITIGSSMATKVQTSVDGGAYSSDNNISASGTYTIDGISASSVVFKCTGTSKTSRLYLNYLSVTYEN